MLGKPSPPSLPPPSLLTKKKWWVSNVRLHSSSTPSSRNLSQPFILPLLRSLKLVNLKGEYILYKTKVFCCLHKTEISIATLRNDLKSICKNEFQLNINILPFKCILELYATQNLQKGCCTFFLSKKFHFCEISFTFPLDAHHSRFTN